MIIPGYCRYDISEDGTVTDLKNNRVLKSHDSMTNGYLYKIVRIVDDSKKAQTVSVIRLLAMAYLEKPDCACVARAKDGDNTNAVLSNVEWVPCCRFVQRAWKDGKMSGRRAKTRCYGDDSISLLYSTLQELDAPISAAELSRLLDISYSTVRYSIYALIEQGKVRRVKDGVVIVK